MDAKLYDLNICEHFLVMIKNEESSDVNEDGDFFWQENKSAASACGTIDH